MASDDRNAGPAEERPTEPPTAESESASRASDATSSVVSQANPRDLASHAASPAELHTVPPPPSTLEPRSPSRAHARSKNMPKNMPDQASDEQETTTSPNTSTSTHADSAGSSPTTSRDTTLDFAKREVSGSQAQHSFSVLSSMTRRSPQQRSEELEVGEGGEPVLQANDRERIRTPASAALRRTSSSNDQIGRQESFGDNNTGSSSSERSVDRREAATGALSNPASAPPSETTSAEASPKDSLGFNFAPQRRRRHYEPARVVLHKSELQPASNANGHGDSAGNSGRTSKTTSEYELDPSTMAAAVPALAQRNSSPPASPDAAISGSLKQLREPRQPIYIPAVLRPTDFESYKTTAGISRLPAAASRRPVTQHWVRDAQAHRCTACERIFTWYRRKHHCRKCGSVFCATDTSDTIGLDRNLNFSLLGIPCRACSSCADEFAKYCLEAPRLRDGPAVSQPPAQGGEQEEVEVAGGGDWSTF